MNLLRRIIYKAGRRPAWESVWYDPWLASAYESRAAARSINEGETR